MGADELNAQLLMSVDECESMDSDSWERYRIFWFDGRADEFGEQIATYSLIFYARIRAEST